MGYICFLVTVQGLPFLLVIFVPPALFFGFFALPLGRDQPTEVWALAKLRFFLKPRKRVWDQSGAKELVTITAPKKVEKVYTDGLNQTQVRSRLKALATTIDSHGWATKNASDGNYSSDTLTANATDRLVDLQAVADDLPGIETHIEDDILDEDNNPVAKQLDNLINRNDEKRRQALIDQIKEDNTKLAAKPAAPVSEEPSYPQAQDDQAAVKPDYWFMGQNPSAKPLNVPQPKAADLPDEESLSEELHKKSGKQNLATGHMRTLRTEQASAPTSDQAQATSSGVTTPMDPAILALASNNDLNVATLARQAKAQRPTNEVVVQLH